MKRIVYIIALALTGCLPDKPKPTPTPTQRSADGFMLNLLAAQYNAAQSNWTVLVIPRTNLWPSK